MAKITEKTATDEPTALEPAPELLTFRDQLYTSRTLIIPKTDRTLSVAKGLVAVAASDEQAISFLKASEEFQPLKE